jgi:hypothetical protein
MEPSKKLYILIGGLILVILIVLLIWFFSKEGVLPVEKEKPAVFPCPEQVTFQGDVYNTVEIGGQSENSQLSGRNACS